MLGNGNGTFQTQVTYIAGGGPSAIALGDFNGDGNLGSGNSTFRSFVPYPTDRGPFSVATGDLNGDGKLDLAVANETCFGPCTPTVSVSLGNGDGTFRPRVDYTTVANSNLDLAVSSQAFGKVSILLGNGDGTFRPKVDYGVASTQAASVATADFNGDGKLDLVTANLNGNTVSIPLGNGDGTFQPAVTYAAVTPSAVTTGDFNGDGKLDLAVTDSGSPGSALFCSEMAMVRSSLPYPFRQVQTPPG